MFLFRFVLGGITRVKICRMITAKNTHMLCAYEWLTVEQKNTSLNKAWVFLRSRVCPLSVAIVKTLFGGFSQNSKQKLKYSISYTLENLSLSLSFSLPPIPLSCDMNLWKKDKTRNNNKKLENDSEKWLVPPDHRSNLRQWTGLKNLVQICHHYIVLCENRICRKKLSRRDNHQLKNLLQQMLLKQHLYKKKIY